MKSFERHPQRDRPFGPLPPISSPARQTAAWQDFLCQYPWTHFITVKLCQSRMERTSEGSIYVRYTPDDYAKAARDVQKRVSCLAFSKTCVKRHRRYVEMIASLEGGDGEYGQHYGDYHYHLLAVCPQHMSWETFEQILKLEWEGSPITSHQSAEKSVLIEPVLPGTANDLTKYILKQGPSGLDPLLTRAAH